jgi:hypothetical protein
MLIKKTRIRNLQLHLSGISPGDTVVFALHDLTAHQARLQRAGFPLPLVAGTSVLPTARGPVSRYNAEGKYLIHRDQPKETVYHQREWSYNEWHGPYQVPATKVVDIPYERYPRTFVPPPSVEFKLVTTADDILALVTDPVAYKPENFDRCIHTVNLLLEYFGECHVLNQNLDSIIRVEVRRLNWDVLPKGERPWPQMQSLLKERIPRFDSDRNAGFRNNLAFLNDLKPNFAAVGRAGFAGYVIVGFSEHDLYICESYYKNNATYVFAADWERLSQMTKAEILNQQLQKDRIIHMPGWQGRVRRLFRSDTRPAAEQPPVGDQPRSPA